MTAQNLPSSTESFTTYGPPWKPVVNCYSAVDRFFPACGLRDLTEGMYYGNPKLSYAQAEINQLDYLLDRVGCGTGRRILDLGCGYGTLLGRVRLRSATGVGITISPEQARYCRRRMLNVHQLDYRAIPTEWDRAFDGVIANGSIEHFVQPSDVAAGRQNDIYRNLFARVHRLIDPASPERRFVTTTIHFARKPTELGNLLRNPFYFRWGSDAFHWAALVPSTDGRLPVF